MLAGIVLKIKKLQATRRMSVKDISLILKVTPQTIYDYYSGKSNISINNLSKFADIFDVPIVFFFEDIDYVRSHSVVRVENESLKELVKNYQKEIYYLKKINKLLEYKNGTLSNLSEKEEIKTHVSSFKLKKKKPEFRNGTLSNLEKIKEILKKGSSSNFTKKKNKISSFRLSFIQLKLF